MEIAHLVAHLANAERTVGELKPQVLESIDKLLAKSCPNWPGLLPALSAAGVHLSEWQHVYKLATEVCEQGFADLTEIPLLLQRFRDGESIDANAENGDLL